MIPDSRADFSIQTGKIINWQGLCTTQDRQALQQLIKITNKIIYKVSETKPKGY